MSSVLAVDPGGTTGLAYWQRDELGSVAWAPGQVETAEEFATCHVAEQLTAVELVAGYLRGRHGTVPDVLVCESFQVTAATLRKSRGGSLAAIEIIGALRWLAHRASVSFVLQTPADAATFSTDAKLRALGWRPGNDHERSATRHLVLYLTRAGLLDARRFLT